MFRLFNTENFGSVGQRAAKLLAVKVGLLKKKSANSAITAEVRASTFGPGLSVSAFESSQSLMDSKFESL